MVIVCSAMSSLNFCHFVEDDDEDDDLMKEIQSLIQPPVVDATTVLDDDDDSIEWRKPKSGEYCNFCHEGGELICCDSCPASYHMTCHNPPLSDSDVEKKWLCHRCVCAPNCGKDRVLLSLGISLNGWSSEKRASSNSPNVSRSSTPQPGNARSGNSGGNNLQDQTVILPLSSSTITTKPKHNKLSEQNRQILTAKNSIRAAILETVPVDAEALGIELSFGRLDDIEAVDHLPVDPFSLLTEAAKSINSRQFSLPSEVEPSERMPFDEEVSNRNEIPKGARSMPHEADPTDGLIPLPAKKCYVCSRSCVFAPLIQCDYCDLLFHMDCLDPPLSIVPTDRWMCPCHVEPFLDQKMLTSLSYTERVKLWNKHARQPVDEETVKLNFLNKVHRQHPPFRRKRLHLAKKNMIKIPPSIKSHYERKIQRESFYLRQPVQYNDQTTSTVSTVTFQEQEQWLAAVLRLQADSLGHLLNLKSKSMESQNSSTSVVTSVNNNDGLTDVRIRTPQSDVVDHSGVVLQRPDPDSYSCQNNRPSSLAGLYSLIDSDLHQSLDITQFDEMIAPKPPSPAVPRVAPCKDALALAVLRHESGTDFRIYKHSVTIGQSGNCTISTNTLPYCVNVDDEHVVISYDQYFGTFELLNLSVANGTLVDGIFYRSNIDISRGELSRLDGPSVDSSADLSVRKYLSDCKLQKSASRSNRLPCGGDSSPQSNINLACHCNPSGKDGVLSGWDGAAQLRNGSVIEIGCLKFLFAVGK